MRHALRNLVLTVILLGTSVASAYAVTIQDLVKLKAAGLSDEILVALIESDGSVFRLTANDILTVRDQGLGDAVILAMLRTVTRPHVSGPVAPAPTAVHPSLPTADLGDAARTEEVVALDAPAPVVVNVVQRVSQTTEVKEPQQVRTVYVPYGVPVYLAPAPPPKPVEPVYWGFGGQRRPDTWKER